MVPAVPRGHPDRARPSRWRALLLGLVLAVAGPACTGAPTTAPAPPTTTVAESSPARPSSAPTPLPSPFRAIERTPGIAYGPNGEQVLDTYVPGDAVASPTGDPAARPAVLLVHGGGWVSGTRTANHAVAASLASLGWVAVSIDYRLAPAHTHPAAVEDVRAALHWVHDHAAELGIDPDRVVLGGDSAGGNLSGLVALADDRPPVAAWVSWSGVYDLAALPAQLAGTEHAFLTDHIATYLGCEAPDATACADRAASASPVTHASPDDPPALLLHSTDELIPLADAQAMRRALDDAGARVRLATFEGSAHGGNLYGRASEQVADFLSDVLALER